MKREWNKYIHKNRTCGDCQLVTAVNAYHYLTGRTVTKKRYMKMADECGCCHGACISPEKAWKKLGIKIVKTYNSLPYKKKIPLPLEAHVWHRKCGYHSVLIVDHVLKSDSIRITNFPWETTTDGWMFMEDIYKFEKPWTENISEYLPKNVIRTLPKQYPFSRPVFTYRQFGLVK